MARTSFRVACTLLLSGFVVMSAFAQSVVREIPFAAAVPLLNSPEGTGAVTTANAVKEDESGSSTPALNIAGTYRCGPDTKACQWLGATITVTQSGTKLEIKSEKGDTAYGELMGNVAVTAGPPFNMVGAISAGGRTLEWSNGTKWTRQ